MAVKKSMKDLLGNRAAMQILEEQVAEATEQASPAPEAAPVEPQVSATVGEGSAVVDEQPSPAQAAPPLEQDEPSTPVQDDQVQDEEPVAAPEPEPTPARTRTAPVGEGSGRSRQPAAPYGRTAAAPNRQTRSAQRTPPASPPDNPPPTVSGRPHYSTLVRKDLRVFSDQQRSLAELTLEQRDLRGLAGERISDNTFVRIAIDLLLERRHELAGATEDELRESLGLPPRY